MNKKVIHSVFQEVVKKQPSRIAVEAPDARITYHDLNITANRIAALLHTIGCTTGTIVTVLMPSSIELVGAMLGVFKAGGVYLPADISFSEHRLRQIFTQTFDGIVIVHEDTREAAVAIAAGLGVDITHLILVEKNNTLRLFSGAVEKAFDELPGWSEDPALTVDGDSSNYIFFTSGSTGEAKPILGAHAGLSHFVHWEIREFGIDDTCRISQITQITFDASLRDIFVALIAGGTLCIPAADTKNNPAFLLNWIADNHITMVHCVPSLFRVLTKELQADHGHHPRSFPDLKYILMAGEILYGRDIAAWRKVAGEGTALVNLYGATETTLIKTFYRIREIPDNPAHIIPAGVPISNCIVAIVKDNHICRAGEIGEIYVKTPFATKGYYKNEALTAQCFVQNPLSGDAGDIVYKTGDLGRYLEDGNIEVLGRLDSQVKINGVRVELQEVELAMLKHSVITGAVAKTYRSDDNQLSLIAYYTGEKTEPTRLREMLGKYLNGYMMPAYFIHLPEFPLSINGKIDKKALPLPEEVIMGDQHFEPPVGDMETALAEMWKEILGLGKVSRNTSFFSIGGHSLRAIQLVSRIHRGFDVSLKITDIFTHRTIEEQARLIGDSLTDKYETITVAAPASSYVLSSSQRRLWLLSQFAEGNKAYNMQGSFVLDGHINKAALEAAFKAVLVRHESLRTVFRVEEDGAIRQYIHPAEAITNDLLYQDLAREEEKALLLESAIQAAADHAFDLAAGPLVHLTLFRLSDKKWVLSYVMHHIISDGWSMSVFMNELLGNYNVLVAGNTLAPAPLKLQYKDYAVWQQSHLEEDKLNMQKAYWLKQFEGQVPVLEFPADKPRPVVKTFNGGKVVKTIDTALTEKMKQLCQKEDATLFMGLLTVVSGLLYKYSGQEDMIIGSPVAGRDNVDLEDQIGFYVNTIALKNHVEGTHSITGLLASVKQTTLAAYGHQAYPFDELIAALDLARDTSRNALFDVMVILQNTGLLKVDEHHIPAGIQISEYHSQGRITSKFDLLFNFHEADGDLRLILEYNSDIYHHNTAVKLAAHFEQFLAAVVSAPATPVDALSLLTPEEKEQLLVTFNATAHNFSKEKTMTALFEEQVLLHPERTAVIAGGKEISYQSLNELANRLGNYLRINYNIRPDERIAVKLERSEWMVITLMGILKSGAAYVPIDPGYPEERVSYLLTDSSAKILIDEAFLEVFRQVSADYGSNNPEAVNSPADLMYVIYTSGSTGKPKGCMLEHRGVVNRIEWMWHQFGFNVADIILQKTTYTFDVSVWEIFMPLCMGAKMVIADKQDIGTAESLLSLIDKQKITCMHFVPGMMKNFMTELAGNDAWADRLQNLRRVITSGEVLSPDTMQQWYSRTDIPVYNLYGPTEASIDVTWYPVAKGDNIIPIGRPVWNTQMHIMDKTGALLPVGAVGEIAIAGMGLARGYLNKPELTTAKFIANPFHPGSRLYLTGDIGRWLPDGNIEYLGRKDEQVKVRGIRIELEEIEHALREHEKVEDAVVIARPDVTGDVFLLAYVTGREKLDTAALRASLLTKLPSYMVPAAFMQLARLPLTGSGKVDRKNLPVTDIMSTGTLVEYVAPRNDIETALVDIWKEVLGKVNIGVKDNFFELGGHSLKAMRLFSRVNKAFDVSYSLDALFSRPTIEDMAAEIERACWVSTDMLEADNIDNVERYTI
ncbi:non-ribosomal peptide synthetase [Chitinophaga varians]|uniref:non-ribosomal peptide synthetase n=1 Tax=Chitinophaga varians TaxID=2202339 RepID=UPI00165ED92E|nr:non-ribosomal peptide synthetase [Chitinophaga varians]MBC9915654.1 amino acid adenylation domain-containing protein [Chitinophaga varians]